MTGLATNEQPLQVLSNASHEELDGHRLSTQLTHTREVPLHMLC